MILQEITFLFSDNSLPLRQGAAHGTLQCLWKAWDRVLGDIGRDVIVRHFECQKNEQPVVKLIRGCLFASERFSHRREQKTVKRQRKK